MYRRPGRYVLLALVLGVLAWVVVIGGVVLAAQHVSFAKGGFW